MKRIKVNWNEWIIRFVFLMLVIIGYRLVSNYQAIFTSIKSFIKVLSPFIMGFALAYLLNGAQGRIKSLLGKTKNTFIQKNKHGLSVLILYCLLILAIFLLLNFIVPLLIRNMIELLKLFPTFINYLMGVAAKIEDNGFSEFFSIEDIVASLVGAFSFEKLLNQWSHSLASIGQLSMGVSSFVLNTFLTLVISIYVLVFKESLLDFTNRFFGKLLPEKTFTSSKYWLQTTNKVFYKFITSQFLDACIIALLSTIILSVLRVPFAITLALLLGVANMIPYFGSIFASVFVAVVTLFTTGPSLALITLIALTILQQIDGNIIGPRIMAGSLNLNPIVIIISITIGGAYFGVLGMFLAVPVAAIIKIVTMNWLDRDKTSETKEALPSLPIDPTEE
ncbi:AI-2E family transporter [Enterococcus sp. LJL98]